MAYTLETFYRSQEWRKLRRLIISERLLKDGDILCEHCGKPIFNNWDIIAHHKEHLTEQNVNDLNVSLNKENIALLHHICHNRIHEKFSSPLKKVYLVFGSPSSGKTTYINSIAEKDDLIVDIDRIFECINNYRSNKVFPNVMKVFNDLLDVVETRSGKWKTAYVVIANCRNVERLYNRLGAELIYVDTEKETCIKQAKDKINKYGESYLKAINDFFIEWNETYSKLLKDKL